MGGCSCVECWREMIMTRAGSESNAHVPSGAKGVQATKVSLSPYSTQSCSVTQKHFGRIAHIFMYMNHLESQSGCLPYRSVACSSATVQTQRGASTS